MSAAEPGMTSRITMSAGTCARSETVCPVSIVPPSERRSPASAVVIADDPPTATGQPPWWPAAVSMSPAAELPGRSRRVKPCAAMPVNSAPACGPRKWARAVAGISAGNPKRASSSG
ncbi:Uncharacterised protein [Mycobacteroides abscessus subsp. abscessus]|nr:Uncharacterised protein [Mycobacteroides abscessus subsp. abscessus]